MVSPGLRRTLHRIRRHRRDQPDGVLLEGPHLVQAGLEAGLPIQELFVTPEFFERNFETFPWLGGAEIPISWIPAEQLAALTDADSPRGVIALARLTRPKAAELFASQSVLEKEEASLPWVYLDTIQDPRNLGAIARAAEAFGAPGLLLSPGCAHPNHPRALRGSAGSLLRLSVGVEVSLEDLATYFPKQTFWAGLVARGGSRIRRGTTGTALLAVGSEGRGLHPELEARLDERWTIPLCPPVESLNVAVALGICLYELAKP